MRPQRNRLLLAATLAVLSVLAVWLIWREDTSHRASSERHARPNRDRPAGGRKDSRITNEKPARELSNDDLAAIYQRKGAAAALAAAKSQPWPYRDNRVSFILNYLAVGNPELAAAELKTSGLGSFLKTGVLDAGAKKLERRPEGAGLGGKPAHRRTPCQGGCRSLWDPREIRAGGGL